MWEAEESQVRGQELRDFAEIASESEGAARERAREKLRPYADGTVSVHYTVNSPFGPITAEVDTRGLPSVAVAPKHQALITTLCWACRTGGIAAQKWATELFAEAVGHLPSLAEQAPDAGPLVLDLAHGVPDWPDEADPFVKRERDDFVAEIQVKRWHG